MASQSPYFVALCLIGGGSPMNTIPTRPWIEKDGVIYFSVTSDGKSGPEWIAYLEKKGDQVGDYAKQLFCYEIPYYRAFVPTSGVTYQVAVLKGMIFSDKDRVTKKIHKDAVQRKLVTPNAEIAFLIRDKFTDKEIEAMGLTWIITMHEPITDFDGCSYLLYVSRYDDRRCLNAHREYSGSQWGREDGFAFVLG